MRIFCDTSVLVASLVQEHVHHTRAMPVVQRVVEGKDTGFVAAHSLAETYAVLTSLPVAPRIGPDTAQKLLEENVIGNFEIVTLTAKEHETLVSTFAERGVVGGAVYDAIILLGAVKCGAERIFTFNLRDLHRLAPDIRGRIAAP